jgi:hypothetical protein
MLVEIGHVEAIFRYPVAGFRGSPPPSCPIVSLVRVNQNHAGIYGAVTRIGRLAVGQTVFLGRDAT